MFSDLIHMVRDASLPALAIGALFVGGLFFLGRWLQRKFPHVDSM